MMRAMTSVIFRKNETVGATSYTQGQVVDLPDDATLRGLLISSTVAYHRANPAPVGSKDNTKGVRGGAKVVNVDLASIAANSVTDTSVTVAGVKAADGVVAQPPAALPAGLTYSAYVTADNTVKLRVQNTTGAAIDAPAGNWRFWTAR